jgi:hypothetical protein
VTDWTDTADRYCDRCGLTPDVDCTCAPDDDGEPQTEAQPDMFCDCRPGTEIRHRWQHAPECLHWAPPMVGSGSTDEHRAKVLAYCRSVIAEAKRRHQETRRS